TGPSRAVAEQPGTQSPPPATAQSQEPPRRRAFAALAHRGYGGFVIGGATAMLADNTEHVISYWVLHQKFHSPALRAFAGISHWVPYLLLAGYSRALPHRYHPPPLIQF